MAVWAGAVLAAGAHSSKLAAQSESDLAAWNGLMLSPVGALPPTAHDLVDANSARNELSVRYGRWRYDLADAIHNNTGVTLSHRLGFASTGVGITGAYLSLSCKACSSWALGGVDVQSTFWRYALADMPWRSLSASLGVRASIGGARSLGIGHATAVSAAAAVALGIGFPFIRNSRLSASVLPGFGFGRIASVDETANGTRPTLGGAVAWMSASGIGVDIGIQRIVIAGGPAQIGLGLSWGLR